MRVKRFRYYQTSQYSIFNRNVILLNCNKIVSFLNNKFKIQTRQLLYKFLHLDILSILSLLDSSFSLQWKIFFHLFFFLYFLFSESNVTNWQMKNDREFYYFRFCGSQSVNTFLFWGTTVLSIISSWVKDSRHILLRIFIILLSTMTLIHWGWGADSFFKPKLKLFEGSKYMTFH